MSRPATRPPCPRLRSCTRTASATANASIWDQIAAAMPKGTPFSSFMAYLQPRAYETGELVLRQGGAPTEIIFIESGRVTVNLAMPDGGSIRLRVLTMGTMIGELGLYLNQPRSASAIADVPTRAYILTTAKLREMEQNDPAFANALHFVLLTLVAKRLAGTTGLLLRLVS